MDEGAIMMLICDAKRVTEKVFGPDGEKKDCPFCGVEPGSHDEKCVVLGMAIHNWRLANLKGEKNGD